MACSRASFTFTWHVTFSVLLPRPAVCTETAALSSSLSTSIYVQSIHITQINSCTRIGQNREPFTSSAAFRYSTNTHVSSHERCHTMMSYPIYDVIPPYKQFTVSKFWGGIIQTCKHLLPYISVSQTGFWEGVSGGSERRKCVVEEEFYWRSKICTYELKLVWPYSTLIITSLRTVALGVYCKYRRHGVYYFDFLI